LLGEDKQYKKRIYLLYDGIHYDPLVWNLAPEANNKDWDVKVFNPEDYKVEQKAQAFAHKEFQVIGSDSELFFGYRFLPFCIFISLFFICLFY
jgi:hypothetical protein